MRREIKSKIEKIKDLKEQIEALEAEAKFTTRKLQRTPSGSFFVCLPKDWCKKQGLDKGSLLTISEQEDSLVIVA